MGPNDHLAKCLRRAVLVPVLLLFASPACIKAKSTSPTAQATDGVILSGVVRSAQGAAEASVSVYAEAEGQALAQSAADGTFSVTLDSATLARIQATLPAGVDHFRLYVDRSSDPSRRGASDLIALAERGQKALGSIVLSQAATVSGSIVSAGADKSLAPVGSASVRIGRYAAQTGTDGKFTISGLPSGTGHLLVAAAPGYQLLASPVDVSAGEQKSLPTPLVMFKDSGVQGLLLATGADGQAKLIASGHPYQRTFIPRASASAKYLRYASDQGQVQSGAAPWLAIPSSFDFDFPKDGGNVLYYQFADDARQNLTPIGSYTLVLDEFGQTKGLVIEDGSGRVFRRDVSLRLDVPVAAYRVRFAEAEAALAQAAWLEPAATMPYTFALEKDPTTGRFLGFGLKTIYMQYQDALGLLSPTYKASTSLEMFPTQPTGVFQINGGATSSPDRLVSVRVTVPPNAVFMRLWEAIVNAPGTNPILASTANPTDNNNKTRNTIEVWLAAQSNTFFTFPSSGMKTLYLQFKTRDNVESPVYQQAIRIDPFPDQPAGFTVNGGATVAQSPVLNIQLTPPDGSQQFMIFEADSLSTTVTLETSNLSGVITSALSNTNTYTPVWQALTPRLNYVVTSSGSHLLKVKFRNADKEESGVYQQAILVDPYPPPIGSFVINGGAQVSLSRQLQLSIQPPPNATAMAVGVDLTPDPGNGNWVTINNFATAQIPLRTGPHTIYLRFKTSDFPQGLEQVSPALAQTIFYDPFPLGSLGLMINGGAATTVGQQVALTFVTTPNVTKFRVADAPEDLATKTYQALVPSYAYTLPAGAGDHRVYVQYATDEGDESPAYFATIAN